MEKRRTARLGKFFRLAACLGVALFSGGGLIPKTLARDVTPWKSPDHALVIDAYELNIIDWDAMLKDKRIAGFISKASDGLPESFACTGDHAGDTVAHCKTMWRKYAVSRELYQTRRLIARASGLLWGAYHLARPGNPVDQANHFLDYAQPRDDELMVLDIEGIDPEKYMSLEDAAIFAGHIRTRTGRYPMLYTNHATARYIAANRDRFPILSRLPLWYARYKPGIRNVFPMGNWDSYALWQFSAASNCGKRRCPYRVAGTLTDIDVNVAAMSATALKAVWAKGELLPEKPLERPVMIASGKAVSFSGAGIGVDMTVTGSIAKMSIPLGLR
ncbi:GH25 family lysozyme [Rhizobium sp. LjRoot98]|uniref:glycoside hydrolase family 25 protein n=1 Tax=unclassified Rhizobium TaxID=2613769 RepID=UPI000715C0F4|nr:MULTISPECIES: GH25 family lysozyme [unclassified Rhizobium]KQV34169.1 lysozyme [Rhizobium sp. Root1204]KQY17533.1 lysozyme [Rhizobium sp. Root1334]KRC13412.1 lysozyme [Rhizobium sp. Root73]